jgi:hypothetical protein
MSDKNRFNLDEEEVEAGQEEGAEASGGGADDDADYNSPERFEADKSRLVDFLQYPRDKRKLTEFMEETYKAYEQEAVDRTMNRVVHEHNVEMQGSTPFYKPGHIGSLMYEYLNMVGVEAAFVSGLQHTKASMTKTVQQRVDEINTLLRGVGGFNRQIKASFSRSAVVYLEHEDPSNPHREKVCFTVNLGDFELRYPLDESADQQTVEDGRTLRRMVWDEAVNTLAEIVSNTGMKPKYVKNDKNSCVFSMRQYLTGGADKLPDEFFVFDLRHVNEEMKERMAKEYIGKVDAYNAEVMVCRRKLKSFWLGGKAKAELSARVQYLEKERDFFVGTNPDPREMDTGIVFTIAVNTLKDYSITKDKMQVIMTKYILALSRIAVDKSLDQQVNTVYQRKQAKPQNFQNLAAAETAGEAEGPGKKVVVMKDDLLRRKKVAGGGRFKP